MYKDPYKMIILNEQVLYARYSATNPSFLCLHTTELVILKKKKDLKLRHQKMTFSCTGLKFLGELGFSFKNEFIP